MLRLDASIYSSGQSPKEAIENDEISYTTAALHGIVLRLSHIYGHYRIYVISYVRSGQLYHIGNSGDAALWTPVFDCPLDLPLPLHKRQLSKIII